MGAYYTRRHKMANRKSVIGETYGYLKVISDAYYPPNTPRKVNVVCECGGTKTVRLGDLRAGYTKSCGCKTLEMLGKTHGDTKTPLYRVWINMRSRCLNPKAQYYSEYGGRGITISPVWDDYSEFKKWSYENGYCKGLTLDRKDNNKGYCPENCRWVSRKVNQSNRRSTKGSTSKYVGVSFSKSSSINPWVANIKSDGVNRYLGAFPTEIEAAKARDAYVRSNNLPHTLNF